MADDIDDDLQWLIGDDDSEKDDVLKQQDKAGGITLQAKLEDTGNPSSTTETDDEDDGLTPEERELLERNTLLNDASDRDEYDLRDKVEKANADLEKTRTANASRETRVMFKQNLVDVEAQPPDYSSDSSSSSSDSEDDSRRDSKETEKSDDENDRLDDSKLNEADVLVEKDGKFGWMSEATNHAAELNDSQTMEAAPSTTKIRATRPRSAPAKSSPKVSRSNGRQRPASASKSHEYSYIKSPYAMSSEMKELMKKRQAARAAQEEEERAQERAKEEQNRKNSEEAWKAWLERKDQEVVERKKKQQEEEKRKELNYDPKQEADEAYQLWLKEKRKQRKKERIHEQQRQLEVDEGWYRRDRKECDQAYKRWLRQKHKETRTQKTSDKKQIQRTRADIYRMRQLQRLISSIRSSQKR